MTASVCFLSKYIGGQTDVIGGCVTTRTLDHWKRLKLQQLTTGSALSPFYAALLARGLKTLPLRVDKICTNADRIAQFLAKGVTEKSYHLEQFLTWMEF
ncbi:hypothetical protein GCK32_020072 [Trichostrongylus colubriformis]|uniref:Gamma-cystathionase n=1 Tax=Trichostrongylus colubriformis TaxID=6319 RepID=A0AAN8J1W2_TRICO